MANVNTAGIDTFMTNAQAKITALGLPSNGDWTQFLSALGAVEGNNSYQLKGSASHYFWSNHATPSTH